MGENKITLLDLTEKEFVEENTKLQNRVMIFSNQTHCQKISADGTQ